MALLGAATITAWLHAAAVSVQAPARPASPEQQALTALDRVKPPIQFAVYAARAGDDLQVAIEEPADAVAAGRWKNGADLTALAEGADGQGVGFAEGTLSPSGHALLRLPIEPGASVRRVAVRLHALDEVLIEAAPVAERTTLVGDPLVYRAGRHATADPIAILWFSRHDAIRVEWPILAPLSGGGVRLLDATGRPTPKRLTLDRTDPRVLRLRWKVPRLEPGDYLVEMTATGGAVHERTLLAIRVR